MLNLIIFIINAIFFLVGYFNHDTHSMIFSGIVLLLTRINSLSDKLKG